MDPEIVRQQRLCPISNLISVEACRYINEIIQQAELDISQMLEQLQKVTVTQTELVGTEKRAKYLLGEIFAVATDVSALFNLSI